MPHTIGARLDASSFGKSYTVDFGVLADVGIPVSPTVTAAKPGTITALTDVDTATATLTAGHGVLTGDIVDVYWDAGSRVGVTVGTVVGDVVPLDGGTGDAFPAVATVVAVKVRQTEEAVIVGDNVDSIMFGGVSVPCTFTLLDGATPVLTVELAANTNYIWTSSLGLDNPLAGMSVTDIAFSHASPTSDITMEGSVSYS